MTPEEELALISKLLDEIGIPKTLGLGVYSTYGRVDLLAKKVQLTPVPADGWRCPECNAENSADVAVCECGYSKARRR